MQQRRKPQLMSSSCGPPIDGQLMPSSWPPQKTSRIKRRRRQPQLMTSSCGPPIDGQLMPSSWPPQKTSRIKRRRRQPQLMTSSCGPPIDGQLMPSSWPPQKTSRIKRRRRQPQLMTSSCGPPIDGQLMPSSWPPLKNCRIQRRKTTADDLQLWYPSSGRLVPPNRPPRCSEIIELGPPISSPHGRPPARPAHPCHDKKWWDPQGRFYIPVFCNFFNNLNHLSLGSHSHSFILT